ncbi:MAG: hypothetical protein H6581_18550 [Bacteroidia bacterium]|nr:hypothetical protein [Bacteroidia bacterium]
MAFPVFVLLSRRIGLSSGQQVPILGGLRLSGKLTEKWRIGLMNMQTEGGVPVGQEGQNYTVAAFQRQMFGRSNLGGILVNRIGFEGSKPNFQDYNTTAGLDYNIYSASNKIRGKIFYHHNFSVDSVRSNPDGSKEYVYKNGPAQAVWLMYQDNHMTLMYNHEWVHKNYNAEVGYVPRTNYFRFEPGAWFRFFPKKNKLINNHGPILYLSNYFDNSRFKLVENQAQVGYQFSFQNRIYIEGTFTDWYIFLQNEFDPARSGGTPLPDSVGYRFRNGNLSYSSDFRKRLVYSGNFNFGTYYNGTRLGLSGEVQYRVQPWAIFSLAFEHNRIQLPAPYSTASLSLISPRFDFSFTKNIFLTTFFQFNTQAGNFNINARFQWRFKPMSDLFIVLTENYGSGDFKVRNRAIVFKLNYWFAI